MPKRPNILMLGVDDLNNHVRCLGKYADAHTPNIDALAARGTCFRNAHCPAPICLPARTTVLSGMQPTTTGCYVNVNGPHDAHPWTGSPAMAQCLPMPVHFRRHGYHTAHVGKTFHFFADEADDAARLAGEPIWIDDGTQEAMAQGGQQFQLRSQDPMLGFDAQGDGPDFSIHGPDFSMHGGPLDGQDADSLTDTFSADWCIDRLQRFDPAADAPFFLAAGFLRPHTPLTAPRRFFDLYDRAAIQTPDSELERFRALPGFAQAMALTAGGFDQPGGDWRKLRERDQLRTMIHAYLAGVSYVDSCIGRVLDALAASPHADDTIVALWVDHGWSLGEHCHIKKWALWSHSTNVPLIIARPGDADRCCDTPVGTLDLYPTLSDLAGLPARPEWEGHSLRPLLDDPQAAWPHAVRTTYGPGNHAVRSTAGTLIRYADGSQEGYRREDLHEQENCIDDPDWATQRAELVAHLPQTEAMPLHWAGHDPRERVRDLHDGDAVDFGCLLDGIANRAIRITATLELTEDDALIVSHYGVSAGYALYVRERRLVFCIADVPRPIDPERFTPACHCVRAEQPVPAGTVTLVAELARDGTVSLRADAALLGSGRVPGPLSHQPISRVEVGSWDGCFRGRRMTCPDDLPLRDRFPGILHAAGIEFLPSETQA